jgi:hypothetical protein
MPISPKLLAILEISSLYWKFPQSTGNFLNLLEISSIYWKFPHFAGKFPAD